METMVATVLIIVIFMLSSLIMNSLFATQMGENHTALDSHLDKLEYLQGNRKIILPYYEEWDGWKITLQNPDEHGKIRVEATKEQESGIRTIEYVFYGEKVQQ